MPHNINTKEMTYFLLVILFALSETSDVLVHNYYAWVAIDYATRIIVISLLAYQVRRHLLTTNDIGFGKVRKDRILSYTLIFGVIAFFYCLTSYFHISALPYPGIGDTPMPPTHFSSEFDRYFGLLLVAVSEEMVFRGLALAVFRKLRLNAVKIVIASSLLYTLTYWSHSAEAMLYRVFFGVIFMMATMLAGNITPAIIIHFAMIFIRYR